jgi:hypothetical protein
MASIPPRLSDQQKFILALLASGDSSADQLTTLSWRVAEEFDDEAGGDGRICDPDEYTQTPEEVVEQATEQAETAEEAKEIAHLTMSLGAGFGPDEPILKAGHSASVSRSLRRLEDRELIRRESLSREVIDDELVNMTVLDAERHTHARLTDAGEKVGDEVRRQASDGRYSLSFETLG